MLLQSEASLFNPGKFPAIVSSNLAFPPLCFPCCSLFFHAPYLLIHIPHRYLFMCLLSQFSR